MGIKGENASAIWRESKDGGVRIPRAAVAEDGIRKRFGLSGTPIREKDKNDRFAMDHAERAEDSMNYVAVRKRYRAGLWLATIGEIMLVVAHLAVMKANDTWGNLAAVELLAKLVVWAGVVAWVVFFVGFMFGYKFCGISRERWMTGQGPETDKSRWEHSFDDRAPWMDYWPLLLLFFLIVVLGGAFGAMRLRNPSLIKLVDEGNLSAVQHRLEQDSSLLGQVDREGAEPLIRAVKNGNPKMVDLLLRYGAALDVPDKQGRTALFHAIGNADMMGRLLEAGAAVNVQDGDGETPLHRAITQRSLGCMELLLGNGADINAADRESNTPLLLAVKTGFEGYRTLLENGADPNLADQLGHAPIHYAVEKELADVALTLIEEGANPAERSRQDWTPLHTAALNGSIPMMELLLRSHVPVDIGNSKSQTPLYCAVAKNQPEAIRFLVENGANLDNLDGRGNTYLHVALNMDNLEAAACLIELGVDVDLKNAAGVSSRELLESLGREDLL